MGIMRGCTFMLWLISIVIPSAYSHTINDTQHLMDDLLTGYNPDIRPAEDQTKPVVVNITFELINIQEFDEVSETFSAIGVLNMQWVDHRMSWDPLLYNNTYMVNIRKKKVWIPDLILTNPKESINLLADRQDWMAVRYLYNGVGYWSPGDVFYSTCKVDVTYYPFDVQNCHIQFISWGSLASEVLLQSTQTDVLLTYFTENGEWVFKSSKAESAKLDDDSLSFYTVYITIERRAAFFLVNVVLPIVFMSFLNVLVFWVPAESGERVSYAITVLLAIAVFLTIVGENMPKTSQPMSILSYFLIINLILSAFICLGAIVNLNVYFKHWEKPVPKWLDAFTRLVLCKNRIKKTPVGEIIDQLDAETSAPIEDQKNDKTIADKWAEAVGEITGSVPRDRNTVTWREVSYAIDKLFGTISVLWLVVSSTCFIAMVATHHAPSWG